MPCHGSWWTLCLPVLRASQAEKDRGSCAELERSPNGAEAWVVWPWRVSGCRGTQGCTGLECGSLSLQLPYSCQLCASKTRYCPQSRRLCLCAHFSHCPKTAEAFIAVQHFSPSVGSGQDLQDCRHYLSGDNPPRGRLGLLNHPAWMLLHSGEQVTSRILQRYGNSRSAQNLSESLFVLETRRGEQAATADSGQTGGPWT